MLEARTSRETYKTALNLLYAKIRGTVYFVDGFESHGEVAVYQAKIGGDLGCDSGHFINPGNIALAWNGREGPFRLG